MVPDLRKNDRVTFKYGKQAVGYGIVKKVYKRKPPKIKFDKTVPVDAEPREIEVLTHECDRKST